MEGAFQLTHPVTKQPAGCIVMGLAWHNALALGRAPPTAPPAAGAGSAYGLGAQLGGGVAAGGAALGAGPVGGSGVFTAQGQPPLGGVQPGAVGQGLVRQAGAPLASSLAAFDAEELREVGGGGAARARPPSSLGVASSLGVLGAAQPPPLAGSLAGSAVGGQYLQQQQGLGGAGAAQAGGYAPSRLSGHAVLNQHPLEPQHLHRGLQQPQPPLLQPQPSLADLAVGGGGLQGAPATSPFPPRVPEHRFGPAPPTPSAYGTPAAAAGYGLASELGSPSASAGGAGLGLGLGGGTELLPAGGMLPHGRLDGSALGGAARPRYREGSASPMQQTVRESVCVGGGRGARGLWGCVWEGGYAQGTALS